LEDERSILSNFDKKSSKTTNSSYPTDVFFGEKNANVFPSTAAPSVPPLWKPKSG